jgi:peptide/nickel transport system ATP-binding protein
MSELGPGPGGVPQPALELVDLEVTYRVRGIDRRVLDGVSLRVESGGSYGLVGESGSGKSTAALAAVRYLPRNGRVRSGQIRIAGRDIGSLSRPQLRQLRANDVSMVYQNATAALNPSIRVGRQVAEVFAIAGSGREQAHEQARAALARVQIADPGSVMERFPHQLSGGMAQRAVIAIALAKDPELLILDEPTTGLDATVEADVLELIATLRAQMRTAVLLISHNLGVVSRMCERVGVLYGGSLVEEGAVAAVLHEPRHPYTVGLLRCIPRGGVRKDRTRLDTIAGFPPGLGEELPGCRFAPRCGLAQEICHREAPELTLVAGGHQSRCHFHDLAPGLPRQEIQRVAPSPIDRDGEPLLRFSGLGKVFLQHRRDIRALAEISAAIWPGEALGLVGESGSGKTTLARTLLGLIEPSAGTITLEGRELEGSVGARSAQDIRALQIVFQDPDSALNRRHSVRRILRRALRKQAGLTGSVAVERTRALMHSVRLAERHASAKPSELSGGLKQRVAIARAFAGTPALVVCDEPTSALDVSVQAAILNLLVELQATRGAAYLFISHDLGVVRYISDRIAVLYLGRLMEIGAADVVFDGPHHPYTEALLSAVPTIDGGGRERIRLAGEIPSNAAPPSGCVFHTRCHRKLGPVCELEEPPLLDVESGHLMRCHIPLERLRELQGSPAEPAAV